MLKKVVGSSCLPYYLCLFLDIAKKQDRDTYSVHSAQPDLQHVCWLEGKGDLALTILHFLGRDEDVPIHLQFRLGCSILRIRILLSLGSECMDEASNCLSV